MPLLANYSGETAMLPVEQNTGDSDSVLERKRWETPVVIVASTQRQTLSNLNTVGTDKVYTVSSIGS